MDLVRPELCSIVEWNLAPHHMADRLMILAGTSHPTFAAAVGKELGVDLTKVLIKRFASNDIYVRLEESVRGRDVFVVQTATQNVNEDFMELFLLCDALKRSFASKVHVIIPFYGYARQDRIALPRETISAKLMADLMVTAGADHVITVDLHSDQIQGFFDVPVDNINPSKIFFEYFEKEMSVDADTHVVISPDVGGAKAAKVFADQMGLPIAILNKQRSQHNESEVTHVVGDVEGKRCIIFDDMVDTAGSVCNAKKALVENGALDEVVLAATHAVFSGEAVSRLDAAGFKEILVTDSIPLPDPSPKQVKVLSLAPLMAEIVKRVSAGESVTGLY